MLDLVRKLPTGQTLTHLLLGLLTHLLVISVAPRAEEVIVGVFVGVAHIDVMGVETVVVVVAVVLVDTLSLLGDGGTFLKIDENSSTR